MRYIALLRGINLGNRRLKMEDLAALFEELKFKRVATFIASGNVIFESPARDAAKLESQIERHLEKSLGYVVDTVLRTAEEIATVAAARPFAGADMDAKNHTINIGFLKEKPDAANARRLTAIRTPIDEFAVVGREYYWLCRLPRMSDSTVWTLPEMKSVILPPSTMRKLTTVQKLAALYPPV